MSEIRSWSKRIAAMSTAAYANYYHLPDGTRFKPERCFALMRTALRIERSGREPEQSDFSPDDWQLLTKLAAVPDPSRISGLADMTCQVARKFINCGFMKPAGRLRNDDDVG